MAMRENTKSSILFCLFAILFLANIAVADTITLGPDPQQGGGQMPMMGGFGGLFPMNPQPLPPAEGETSSSQSDLMLAADDSVTLGPNSGGGDDRAALPGDLTGAGDFFRGAPGSQQNQTAEALEEQILCTLSVGQPQGPTRQRTRAEFVAKHIATMLSRMTEPEWTPLAIRHMMAQVRQETNVLNLLEEQRSSYASSRMEFRGRGALQTTFRENYARLAGCVQTVQNATPPRQITWDQVAEAPPLNESDLVRNPRRAMDENTEQGRINLALSAPCYIVNTAVRHERFAQALTCDSRQCVNEIGVGINRGPGRLGQGVLPLHSDRRWREFQNIEQCFNSAPGVGV
jgi:hypothetical protein